MFTLFGIENIIFRFYFTLIIVSLLIILYIIQRNKREDGTKLDPKECIASNKNRIVKIDNNSHSIHCKLSEIQETLQLINESQSKHLLSSAIATLEGQIKKIFSFYSKIEKLIKFAIYFVVFTLALFIISKSVVELVKEEKNYTQVDHRFFQTLFFHKASLLIDENYNHSTILQLEQYLSRIQKEHKYKIFLTGSASKERIQRERSDNVVDNNYELALARTKNVMGYIENKISMHKKFYPDISFAIISKGIEHSINDKDNARKVEIHIVEYEQEKTTYAEYLDIIINQLVVNKISDTLILIAEKLDILYKATQK